MKRRLFTLLILLNLAGLMTACQPPTKPGGQEVIRIGAAVSATGEFAREGSSTKNGYTLWKDLVNQKGGIQVGNKRYPVEIVYYDDESKTDTANLLTEKLITQDKVNFLLAPYSSGIVKSTSAIAEQHKMIMIGGGASADSLFTRKFKYLFSVMTPANNYTESLLQALSQAGAKTVALAYEDTPFPTNVAEGAKKWAEKYHMKVVFSQPYPKDLLSMDNLINMIKNQNPDIFIGGGHFKDALSFVKSAKQYKFKPNAMILTVGPSSPEFVTELGADANYILGPTQWESTMKYQDNYFGTASNYATRYQAKWGELPDYQAAGATASALVLQLAIEQANSLETNAVLQALHKLKTETFYGPIKFDETGRNAVKEMGSIQIQDRQIKLVLPQQKAVAQMIYPMQK